MNMTLRSAVLTSLASVVLVILGLQFIVFLPHLSLPGLSFDVRKSCNGQDCLSEEEKMLSQHITSLERQLVAHRAALEGLSCRVNDIGLRGGFCLSQDTLLVGGNQHWDLNFTLGLEKLLAGKSVGDFGCGLGWYGKFFLRRLKPIYTFNYNVEETHFLKKPGVMEAAKQPQKVKSWTGFDGAGNIDVLSGGFVNYLDLSESVDVGERYDWVISIEVGEHIPPAYETNFLDNLDRHACEGIVLTWCLEGPSAGHHHVNNHNNEYIKAIMNARGFDNLLEEETKLRSNVELEWLRNTIMVFKRRFNNPHCSGNQTN